MITRDKIKRILQEWKEFDIPQGYARDFDNRFLDGKEILSIIGARRTGKTYLCYQMARWAKQKVPVGNVIYINLEDERLSPVRGDELSLLWDICREMLDVDMTQRVYLFVDEIQNAANWSKWARRITDQHPNIKLIITGSSSKLLSREIATELRGRTLSVNVFPLSFKEFLSARGIAVDVERILYSRERPLVKKAFNEYLDTGGFPAVIDSPNRKELLKEYYSVMFYRDLAERHKVKNLRLLEDYLTLLLAENNARHNLDQIKQIDQAERVGGIDLNARNLKIQSIGKKVDMAYSYQLGSLGNVAGFTPVIMSIRPLADVAALLGIK